MNGRPALPAGFDLLAHEELESTNTEAARLAAEGAADGTLVWARCQSGGRGRRGRSWSSPVGNLYCSLVVRPKAPPRQAAQLGFVAGLALAEAFGSLGARDVTLKWPNDVLLAQRKAAGILLESALGAGGLVDWAVIGTGANLASHPADAEFPATDLSVQTGSAAPVEAMLAAYVAAFDAWRLRWETDGFRPVRAAWLALAWGLGGPIRVRLDREAFEGRFVELDGEGGLVLDLGGGRCRTVQAGDVFPASA